MIDKVREYVSRHIDLTEDEFQLLLSKLRLTHFAKKSKIVNIGEEATTLYFVLKGITRRYFYRGKQEVITHLIREGSLMGSVISFLTKEPSRYVLETIEPVTAYGLTREDLEELFSKNKKWEKFGRSIITHFFLNIERRNLDNIRYTTKERFVNFMKQNPDLVLRVPQKYLASYLEIQPETFSRLKHLMVKAR